jgi:hypothetical protein
MRAALPIVWSATLLAALPASAQSSGGSGTAAQAAALAKSAPPLSAGSFTLGMPREQAIAKLKASGLLNNSLSQPEVGVNFRQLPNQTMFGGSFGTTQPGAPQGSEQVYLLYTTYPTRPVVSGIVRSVFYNPSNAPNVTNTVAALKAKYGTASVTQEYNVMSWFFDRSGRPLSPAAAQKLKQARCLETSTDGFTGAPRVADQYLGGQARKDYLGQKIASGYVASHGGINDRGSTGSPLDPICLGVAYVHAIFYVRKPSNRAGFGDNDDIQNPGDWSRFGNDLVSNLTVYIMDAPLDYAASEASRAAVLGGGARQEQQQMNAAKRNSPNL